MIDLVYFILFSYFYSILYLVFLFWTLKSGYCIILHITGTNHCISVIHVCYNLSLGIKTKDILLY